MYYYRINYMAGSILTLFVTLLLGIIIFLRGRGGDTAKSYAMLMLAIAAYAFLMALHCVLESAFNNVSYALLFARLILIIGAFVPILYFNFIVNLVQLKDKQRRNRIIAYTLATVFACLGFSPYFIQGVSLKLGMHLSDPGSLYFIFIIYFLAYPAYAHYLAYKAFPRLSHIGKSQIKHVIIAGICGLFSGSLVFFSVYGIPIPILGPMAFYFLAVSTFFVTITTYAIRIMGFEVIKRRTLIFSLVYGVTVGSFVSSVFILQRFLSVNFNINRWVVPVIALIVLTIFIRPLEQLLARLTDAVLYQRGYDYMLVLKNIAKGMTLITDTKKLLRLIVRFISKEIRVTGCAVYIFNRTANAYICEVRRGLKDYRGLDRIDAENHLVKWIFEKKEPVSYSNVIRWIQGERVFPQKLMLKRTLEQIRITMERLGAAICVPSFLRGEMIGFIALGPKLSGNIYIRDDFSLLSTLANNAAIAFENARMYEELNERIKKLESLYKEEHALFLDAASAFSYAIELKDGYAHGHSLMASDYAIATTKELEKLLPYINFNDSFYETLRIASLLHDVGKIGIPDKILKKQSNLTKDENEKFKEHVIISHKILRPIREIQSSFDIIRHHHENFDGTGYPDGLKGNEIPMASRIITVCNAYVSMVSGRPNQKPIEKEQALKELEQKKASLFDPLVVDAFIKASRHFKDKSHDQE